MRESKLKENPPLPLPVLTVARDDGHGLTPVESFDLFWSRYPRKVGKQDARRAWDKAVKAGVKPTTILDGLTDGLNVDPMLGARERQFIPHPATWLNGGRWEDEVVRPTSTGRQAELDQSITNVIGALRDAGHS